jgi:hypothetical protein
MMICSCMPSAIIFRISAFCLHSAFVCFIWFAQKIMIISLNNMNWLVFVMDVDCVVCKVPTVFLHFS